MTATPHVLVIGDGGEVAPMLRRVHNARTTTLCRIGALTRVIEAEMNTRILSMKGSKDEWIAVARLIHSYDPFSALGAYTELDQDKAAMIAEDLKLAFHKPSVIAAVYDKGLMRDTLRACGVDCTPARRIDTQHEAKRFGEDVGYPLILKPVSGLASRGISLLRSPADLGAAFRWTKADSGDERESLHMERYYVGQEVSVEAFSDKGVHHILAVTQKFSSPGSFVEIGHIVPAALTDELCEEIYQYVRSVLDALDVTYGATHTELVLTRTGPRVIETHTRAAGGEIPELLRLVYGVDVARLSAAATLGLPLQLAKPGEAGAGAAAVWYFAPQSAGTITRINGIDEVGHIPGVVNVDVNKGPGEHFGGWPLKNSYERSVSVRVHVHDRDEALDLRKRISSLLDFHVTADPDGETRLMPIPADAGRNGS